MEGGVWRGRGGIGRGGRGRGEMGVRWGVR